MRKVLLLGAVIGLVAAVGAWGATKATGVLKVKDAATVVDLKFAEKQTLRVTSKGLTLPEGKYAPESYSVLRAAKDGTAWRIQNYKGQLGALADVTVVAGQDSFIDVGSPLKVAPTCGQRKQSSSGRLTYQIGYSVRGKSGEPYSMQVWKGNCTAPHPHFLILDMKDKVLAEGHLSIGTGGG